MTGESGGEQVQNVRGQTGVVAHVGVVEHVGGPGQERADQRAQPVTAGERGGGDPGDPVGGEAEHLPRDEHQHPPAVVEGEQVRPGRVVDGEVAGAQGRLPAVLGERAAPVQLQPELEELPGGLVDEPFVRRTT